MAESGANPTSGLFNIRATPSNEHSVFAETLRDWRDPLLQGHERIATPVCPRCATCKCESLKDLPNSSSNSIHHHQQQHHPHKHEPTCPNFRQHHQEQMKTTNKQFSPQKRRAISHDASALLHSPTKSTEHSTAPKRFKSKIPVRTSTPTSEYSSSSSATRKSTSNHGSKIPRPISIRNVPSPAVTIDTQCELDSLNDDTYQTPLTMSDNEHNQLDHLHAQRMGMSKKRRFKQNSSIADKRQRRYRQKEGRPSKSSSSTHDLSSSNSSSSCSTSAAVPLRKKSRSYRVTSPSQVLSSLSDDSLSEPKQDRPLRPHSTYVSTNDQRNHAIPPPSLYLIQLTKKTLPANSFGLTKTITCVWKSTSASHDEDGKTFYPRYSIEQVQPIINQKKPSMRVSSRNIMLQCGQTDYWQNVDTSPDSILAPSCLNSTGSAFHLLSSSLAAQQSQTPTHSNGHIISITTTKRCLPSLLNKTKNVQWNIAGDGRFRRYSIVKSHSDDRLHKYQQLLRRYHIQYGSDSNTDSGSSSEEKNLSAPPVLPYEQNTNRTNPIHEALDNSSANTESKLLDASEHDHSIFYSNLNTSAITVIQSDKNSPLSSNPAVMSKPKQISYASTDEDVDELNSHYSEAIDPSGTATDASREKFNTHLSAVDEAEATRTSTEHGPTAIDAAVDIIYESTAQQPDLSATLDEQSSEDLTNRNDLLTLSDDSLVNIEPQSATNNFSTANQLITENSEVITEQDTYFSAKSELTIEKDPYSGYELESITDDEEDSPRKNDSNEVIITSESPVKQSTSPRSSMPPEFEFKLPSFGEWINRAFNTFLSEADHSPVEPLLSRRSSSDVSIHGSQSTIHTSSSSQMITVLENHNLSKNESDGLSETQSSSSNEELDDERSLNDMSSSSFSSEKVDFDTYIIDSNYEKINPSITNEQNEILSISKRSESLLSSITSSIENDDQELMNTARRLNEDEEHYIELDESHIAKQYAPTHTDDLTSLPISEELQYSSYSHDSLLQSDQQMDTVTSSADDSIRTNQFFSSNFYSRDSALDLSDDHFLRPPVSDHGVEPERMVTSTTLQDKTADSDSYIDDETMQNNDTMICANDELYLTDDEKSVHRSVSSSSSEHLIPKEKQTGMYYKAFGSSAALHLAEQYHCEWLHEGPSVNETDKPADTDDHPLRIVHQRETIGDNEDEFYYSPQTLQASCSCPNLPSRSAETIAYQRSYSMTTLDAFAHLNITHETLEQMWLSLLDVAFSEKDDCDLDDYKLRHIIGLSNSYSDMNQSLIEKSRSDNDIFSTVEKKSISKLKSRSFDIASLMKQPPSIHQSANMGLLQGADISEPFADRVISASVQSDLESIQSLEPEQILNEASPSPPPPSTPTIKEPLNYVFNFSQQATNDDYDLESIFEVEEKPLSISISFEKEDIPPVMQIEDTYLELAKFRPHSLSTIPSSRASQYASSIDSDDIFEQEHAINKESSDENHPYHISDDDHGMIGSEFSSPRSRPLSSIHSRPLSPDQSQQVKSIQFSDIDNNAWEESINEPVLSADFPAETDIRYSDNLTSIIPIQSYDYTPSYIVDQIEPVGLYEDNVNSSTFIQQADQTIVEPLMQEDYITIEQEFDINLDPNDLADRLAQLDHSANKTLVHQQEEVINIHIFDKSEQNSKSPVEHLTSIVDEIRQINHIKTSTEKLLTQQQQLTNQENQPPLLSLIKPTSTSSSYCIAQRMDKVSDLEIMKQGKGFKIGYVDRQGTDQRVILTKRIEAGPDVMERDPHIRVPYKGRRLLNQIFSSVLFTNGYNALQEDEKFQHALEGIEVPVIGTNPKHFDESDMISIDIDGPSTMLNSICESIVITQGSVYSNHTLKPQSEKPVTQSISNQYREHFRACHPIKKDKVEVIDSWHDHTIINGSSTPWRSPFKPTKKNHPVASSTSTSSTPSLDVKVSSEPSNTTETSTHEIALSPIPLVSDRHFQTTGTSPITIRQTVDRSCQYSPPIKYDQTLQCYLETVTSYTQVSPHQIPGFLKTQGETQTNATVPTISSQPTKLERSSDSGILVEDNHRMKASIALQVDQKSSSSDSEDSCEVTARPLVRQSSSDVSNMFDSTTKQHTNSSSSTSDIEQEISQLCRERAHILDLLSLNWNRSNIWVELTEAKLNYIIGETDALLRALSFDATSVDNETVKMKMQQYEEDMAELTRQHLVVYRERLEASKKQLDIKIDQLEMKRSSLENHSAIRTSTFEHTPRSVTHRRLKSFLSTSAENLTTLSNQENIASHPQLLDVSFLTSTPSKASTFPPRFPDPRANTNEPLRAIHRPTPRYSTTTTTTTTNAPKYDSRVNNGNLSHMEGLSKSQQAILDETDKLVKDSQQLHTESASQFERARESLLSSETPIRLARATMAASRMESYSGMKSYLPNDVTLAELFKYEQSLAKETSKASRSTYSSTKTRTKS